ncbi:MAG: protein adenylyltransferase SelO family protein, partial [Candidatus Thiodiazotropha sp.]
ALAYAGHQFGHFVPQLGDGRAHLIGEIVDRSGERRDIQLKGSGQTAFSRSGDGRYALGPAIREYIMGEAMHALDIPTTRSLAVTTTGEAVYRETVQPGAVLTRIASSHLRVGTFEYFAARENRLALEQLCDFAIDRHYPELEEGGDERFLQLFDKVMQRQIDLVVEWLRVGFIHGVMNTDNTAISGETIDFGPCAMMGTYSPKTVFSSIDRDGRYAFGNQPAIAQWNMARFAETLLPLIDKNEKQAIETLGARVETFSSLFKQRYLQMMASKLGLSKLTSAEKALILALLDRLERKRLDYTTSFDRLTRSLSSQSVAQQLIDELADWYADWRLRLTSQ